MTRLPRPPHPASARLILSAVSSMALLSLPTTVAAQASVTTTTTTTTTTSVVPVAPAADRPACATADLDRILRVSASSKAAQKRLSDEFEPLFAMTAPLTSVRNAAEKQWIDARAAGKPETEVNALRDAFDQAAKDERTATNAVRQGLEQRKREELRALLQRIETEYQRLGRDQGFHLLMQKGEKEPAYVLVAGSQPGDCKGETDLTAPLIAAIDAPPAKP
jgi:Skp family chaperone for outer membrane proteins